MAVRLLIGRGMIEPLLSNDFKNAIYKGVKEWASLPMTNGKSYYGQPVKTMSELERVYNTSLSKYK